MARGHVFLFVICFIVSHWFVTAMLNSPYFLGGIGQVNTPFFIGNTLTPLRLIFELLIAFAIFQELLKIGRNLER